MNNSCFAVCGDLHITEKTPVNRVDDYAKTILTKLEFILKIAQKNKCNLFQPGDFFDNPSPSYRLFSKVVDLLNKYNDVNIYSIFGQHCMKFRNKENTASAALAQSCTNFILISSTGLNINENITLYGSNYNEDPPEVTSINFNVLLIHRMMIQDKLWANQKEYTQAGSFLRVNKFNVIVSGDNHQGFICDQKTTGKHLFNCGATGRTTIAQFDHKPFIIIFDIDTKKYKQIFIPIEPSEKVFNLEKVEREKEKNENLKAFVTGLSADKEIGMKFEDNLNAFLAEINVQPDIRQIIEESKI